MKHTHLELWGVRMAAVLTGLMGAVNVLSAVTPALASRLVVLESISPLEVRHGSRLATALAGFALLLLAGNLWRRKRVAWFVSVAVLSLSAATHLVKGLDYEEAVLALLLLILLVLLRSSFHAFSDPPSVRHGLQVLASAVVFTLAYGVVGFYLLDRHFSVSFDWLPALRQTLIMFTQFYDPGLQPLTRFGRYFADSIYAVGAITLSYALLMLVRPVLIHRPASAAERARAQAVVAAHGNSSLARFVLFDDKSYYFSPGGSVVAYAARGRVAVALGDPVGPPDDVAATIRGFNDRCARNDWRPAFYQTRPEYLEYYKAAGLEALCIGHEGIVDLATFSLEGGANKPVRTSVNRMNRLGHKAEMCEPPLPPGLLHELRDISDEWLTMMKGTEKRFSVGWFDDEYMRQGRVMVVRAPAGYVTAFANVVPEYARSEVAIDLMRRRQDVENGTMEFLFVSLFEWAKAHGYATFNLGLSALSGVGEHFDDPAVERALHYVYEHIDRFYNFKGLHEFKEKFHPCWSPRYLMYPGATALPAVIAALVRADSGDGVLWQYVIKR